MIRRYPKYPRYPRFPRLPLFPRYVELMESMGTSDDPETQSKEPTVPITSITTIDYRDKSLLITVADQLSGKTLLASKTFLPYNTAQDILEYLRDPVEPYMAGVGKTFGRVDLDFLGGDLVRVCASGLTWTGRHSDLKGLLELKCPQDPQIGYP